MPLGLGLAVNRSAYAESASAVTLDAYVGTGDWWIGEDIPVADGAEITEWLGRRNSTKLEMTSSFGPTFDEVNAGFNGKGCAVYVDANNDQLRIQSTAFYSSWTATTAFAVCRAYSSPEGLGAVIGAWASNTLTDSQPYSDENIYSSYFHSTRGAGTGGTMTRDTTHLLEIASDSTSLRVKIGNASEINLTTGVYDTSLNTSGAYIYAGYPNFDGEIAAFVLTDNTDTDNNTAIRNYLNDYYNLGL